ncbi:hypothetical protein CupriaWKF_08050 [Cupriavidus sp. WKF15]|uniref:hypothetical protein n=1 Tax=Cupriavidus sp. WKF15 TaxID=3032282 RepID=UPI0023E2AD9A|nr:hypothetical protein [Cupriavidus sp. WKF15]WER47486.1 hypothetical protein CupriaWKF_08050 [Cupriavidus sp. WKF15]
MKKLFAALASAALVGTVFAQAGAPASAPQPQAAATKDQARVGKDKADVKADVKADASKPAAKGTHHKKSAKMGAATPEAGKTKAGVKHDADHAKATTDAAKAAPQADTAKATASASTDKTKKQ